MPQRNIPDLILRARAGDRDAFDTLAGLCQARVERLVASRLGKLVGSRFEARDLVQEAFLRAFRSIGQFRGETEQAFWSWLATIARHVVEEAGRRLRARKAGASREVPLDPPPGAESGELPPPAPGFHDSVRSPSRLLRAEERFDRLQEALGRLSPDYREVIRLARLEGLPLRDVARRMGRSEKAVSVLLPRALLKLRELFGATESFHLPDRKLDVGRPGQHGAQGNRN